MGTASAIPPVVPGRLPLLGHLLSLAGGSSRLKVVQEVRKHGPIVRIVVGSRYVTVINDPDLINTILVKQAAAVSKGELFEQLKLFGGMPLPIAEGDAHMRQRRRMQPSFHRKMVGGYVEKMVDTAAPTIDAWKPGTTIDLMTEMQLVAQSVVMSALFSSVPGPEQAHRIVQSVDTVFRAALLRSLLPGRTLHNLPTRGNRRIAAANTVLRNTVTRIIQDHRSQPDAYEDLISLLMAAHDDTGAPLDSEDILSEVTALLAAGTETTAVTLAWLFHELGRNPDLERRLHEEVDSVLVSGQLTADQLGQLPYTGRLVKETLRLYAPWIVTRKTLRPVPLGAYVLPAETDLIISPYAVHRDPDLYADPDRFDPDRWLEDRPQPPKNAYFPFGTGKRMCIGDEFARMEAIVVTALVASRFRLKPVPGVVKPVGEITTHPSRLHMIPVLRRDAPDRSYRFV
ncbi:cytochrome P450 [Streptomyces niveus]|uniref:cytochrome P450 n=1 Tax=Streptomyces niveus TaxID=193462 RepID=UPI0036796DCF